jgi:CheY-like chemotaxis protein
LNVLTADANAFSRGLIGEILRNLHFTHVYGARSAGVAAEMLQDREVDIVLACQDEGDAFDAHGFVRDLRRVTDERIRRLPVIFITSGLTRQRVIKGRDTGFDEFLTRPISPLALRQRLAMVIETPRPFIDCAIYLGPCRRRKNPADYYGLKRRAGERMGEREPLIDQDEIARETPIRQALTQLRQTCTHLRASRPEALDTAIHQIKVAKDLAIVAQDHALHAGLASFESYIGVATPLGQIDDTVIAPALAALEQLAALPLTFAEARDSVAIALGKTIQKKLVA